MVIVQQSGKGALNANADLAIYLEWMTSLQKTGFKTANVNEAIRSARSSGFSEGYAQHEVDTADPRDFDPTR